MKNLLIICMIAGAFFAVVAFNKKSIYQKGYVVVIAGSVDQLRDRVTDKFSDGYELAGGVSYGNGVYMQAMTKMEQ